MTVPYHVLLDSLHDAKGVRLTSLPNVPTRANAHTLRETFLTASTLDRLTSMTTPSGTTERRRLGETAAEGFSTTCIRKEHGPGPDLVDVTVGRQPCNYGRCATLQPSSAGNAGEACWQPLLALTLWSHAPECKQPCLGHSGQGGHVFGPFDLEAILVVVGGEVFV